MLGFVGPVMSIFVVGMIAISYVLEAYVARNINISGSCFFKPCAPQSIKDGDQLFSLFAGLCLFFFFFFFPMRGFTSTMGETQEATR